jgi:LacI family transcriptional regulator
MSAAAPTPHGQVTRADVARYAGVSSAVVSYVVNDGPRTVAPATAARVAEAIRTLGYRPNASARALRTGSTKMLGLVVQDVNNPLYAEWAVAIENAAAARGYAVLLTNSEGDAGSDHRAITRLTGRQIDGLLLTTVLSRPDLANLPIGGIPTVLLGALEQIPGFVSVGVDASAGAYAATSHLIGHGHSSVGLIIGEDDGSAVEFRERGWLAASRDAGLLDGPIARASWSRAGGYDAGRRMFGGPHHPSAVFVSSDMQAVGLLRALSELHLRVPGDVAVVSFDGTEDTRYTTPALTVIRQPVQEMAAEAVDAVLAPPTDEPRPHELHEPELIVRESCGCLPLGSGDATP